MDKITIHTLGPKGTNCELAAKYWLEKNNIKNGNIILYDTLEEAVINIKKNEPLLACVVYPYLHNLVFKNLKKMEFKEIFVIDTYDMVLASNKNNINEVITIASHPAPVDLVNNYQFEINYVNSNSKAAQEVFNRNFDGCITTIKSANEYGLSILKNFGPVSMGFSIHTTKE